MDFRISGRIAETESGKGIKGLLVRARDRDLLFDDLLGNATTDEQGAFEIAYGEKDFRELFDAKPDIYLSVYAPPSRLLAETADAIRWDASKHERFDLKIPRDRLGPVSPELPDDMVAAGIDLPAEAVRLERAGAFDLPRIEGFTTAGRPGSPAVPVTTHYVALPEGGDILGVEVHAGAPVMLAGPVNPFPAQEEQPDVGTDPEQFGDGVSIANTAIAFTPPDRRVMEGAAPYPERLVQLEGVAKVGPIQMAALRVQPVQYDPGARAYRFYPKLSYRVRFDQRKADQVALERRDRGVLLSEAKSEVINALLERTTVFPAKQLNWFVIVPPEEVAHVIITDNFSWPEAVANPDGTTRPPTLAERGAALSGDMVAEFERLAEWKTSKGVRSRVVTVSDIVGGQLGSFTQGGFARDLPEVIRNFCKFAEASWHTTYVLIGGDTHVVPMRKLAGCGRYKTFGLGRHADNPPPEYKCHVTAASSAAKLRPGFTPQSGDPLSTYHGAVRIPFDREAGPGMLGWYYTSEQDFSSKSTGFTRLAAGSTSRFVIVEGPVSVIDDDYYWLRSVNSIPSDFYYASVDGSGYSVPGKHDFDDNHNGLYGQYHYNDVSDSQQWLDPVNQWSALWVGRASADSVDQASAFVDKVIAYETLEADGAPLDSNYLGKIIYAADWWGREVHSRQADTSQPPDEGKFTHATNATTAKLQLKFDLTLESGQPVRRLIARHADFDIVVPFSTSASATQLGWHFTTNDGFGTVSNSATRFVRVRGPAADLNATQYFWDPIGLEGGAKEKEALRAKMSVWYPGFSTVQRHYSDYFDLAAPPPIVPLEQATLRDAIDGGVHFLSLTGHGSSSGCCGVSVSSFTFDNARQFFIAYADSCSTARPDGVDSLAEKSTLDPDGGAVAYVGNTRYSWIGTGDNYERFFWSKLSLLGRAGPAAGMRLAVDGKFDIWAIYAQNLFGDPEMPVWTGFPRQQNVIHPASAGWGATVGITARHLGNPISGQRVTLMSAWQNSATRPHVLMSKTTNGSGTVSFTLPPGGAVPSQLRVTVTGRNFKPYRGVISITQGTIGIG